MDEQNAQSNARSDATQDRSRRRRWLIWGGIALAAIAVLIGGYFYHINAVHHPSTDDAYLKARVVHVAPQVSGIVRDLRISDQQHVDKGSLLLRIDPASFEAAVRGAEAQLAMARQTVAANQAAVAAAEAAVADQNAALKNAETHLRRAQVLVKTQVTSRAQLDDARAARNQAQANLRLAGANLTKVRQQLGTPGDENYRIRTAGAVLAQARLDLAHTRLTAPCAGRISGAAELHAGNYLTAGRPGFSLVCDGARWVYANFEETDLTRLRPGQKATISIDMYPDRVFHGIVEAIDPASGTAFSLLPPENATGNWVKVTQRVPVRILIVDDSSTYPLRVQTSATVTVDTGASDQPDGRPRGATLSDSEAMTRARQLGIKIPTRTASGAAD